MHPKLTRSLKESPKPSDIQCVMPKLTCKMKQHQADGTVAQPNEP